MKSRKFTTTNSRFEEGDQLFVDALGALLMDEVAGIGDHDPFESFREPRLHAFEGLHADAAVSFTVKTQARNWNRVGHDLRLQIRELGNRQYRVEHVPVVTEGGLEDARLCEG